MSDSLSTADLEMMALRAEREQLLNFKSYVHGRLDRMGVPTHPPGPHGAHGCRIGDRLDWLAKFTSGEVPDLHARLRATIAEWREMGEERITAEKAASVIESDLTPPSA